MKINKLKIREICIVTFSGGLTSHLLNLADFAKNPHYIVKYLIFIFVFLGIVKFLTGILDLTYPIKPTAPDPRDVANKAIIKEFFK